MPGQRIEETGYGRGGGRHERGSGIQDSVRRQTTPKGIETERASR